MDNITIYCDSIKGFYDCPPGTSLKDLSLKIDTGCKYPVMAAFVDNQLKELDFKIYTPHTVKFLDYTYPDGRRTFVRTLSFILQKAVVKIFPKYDLIIDYTLPNGLYCELRDYSTKVDNLPVSIKLSMDDIVRIKREMERIIKANLPITKHKLPNDEAVELFRNNRREKKATLVHNMEKFFVSVYYLEGYPDTFYGPLLFSSGDINLFNIIPYSEGFCLQYPSPSDPEEITDYVYQDKLSSVFKENSLWCSILGAHDICSINQLIRNGEASSLIQIAESLHERKFVSISDMIFRKRDKVKLVLIAGPSSSGKTTTSKRIALQCKVLGLNPKVIAMDNYFVNRDKTPRDENGDYNFESIDALDLPYFNQQLNELFAGKEVEIPRFDFKKGERYFAGDKMCLQEDDILITEGIHALNPQLTSSIDAEKIFKIYASDLTSVSLDENNYISTTDNRMLRRMIRDYATRGISPEDTILRWPSVRKGEEHNIFPYQENADAMFNSTLIFELSMLKYYAVPLLSKIPPLSAAYPESIRLLKFLSYIFPLSPDDIKGIPPTSIMREFIGDSTFDY